MQIRDIMQNVVKVVAPHQTVREAAQIMEEAGVGCLPVVDNGRPVGMLTDRDIAVRVDAYGKDPVVTRVSDIMTERYICCHDDQDIDEVLEVMFREHIHRLPVVSHSGRGLMGIVSLNDLAAAALDNKFVSMIVAEGARRPQQRL